MSGTLVLDFSLSLQDAWLISLPSGWEGLFSHFSHHGGLKLVELLTWRLGGSPGKHTFQKQLSKRQRWKLQGLDCHFHCILSVRPRFRKMEIDCTFHWGMTCDQIGIESIDNCYWEKLQHSPSPPPTNLWPYHTQNILSPKTLKNLIDYDISSNSRSLLFKSGAGIDEVPECTSSSTAPWVWFILK